MPFVSLWQIRLPLRSPLFTRHSPLPVYRTLLCPISFPFNRFRLVQQKTRGYPRLRSHKMTSPSSASPSRPRCSHKSQNGKPCRYSAMSGFRFCKHHVPDEVPPSDDALAAILAKAAGHLSCPEDVRRVMAAIFHALVQHRLSSKDAGVLCYIAQTILHFLRTSAYLDKPKHNSQPPRRPKMRPSRTTSTGNLLSPTHRPKLRPTTRPATRLQRKNLQSRRKPRRPPQQFRSHAPPPVILALPRPLPPRPPQLPPSLLRRPGLPT